MTTPDPILNALAQMEQRLRKEIKDSSRDLMQALEFRRRLDALEGRVHELEGRLPPE